MRATALVLALSVGAFAQGQVDPHAQPEGTSGVEVTVGWEGQYPVGWESWSVEARAEHEARMQAARVEMTTYVEQVRVEHPEVEWNAEVSFGLFTHSVNAGFSFGVSMDLVKTMVVEKVKPAEAEVVLKTAVVEAVAAEKDDDDPSDDEAEYKNLGQWVKDQVHGGLHGQDLAAAIHEKVKARHDAKKAEKAAKKAEKEHGKSGDDHGKGKGNGDDDGDKGKGHGKGGGKPK